MCTRTAVLHAHAVAYTADKTDCMYTTSLQHASIHWSRLKAYEDQRCVHHVCACIHPSIICTCVQSCTPFILASAGAVCIRFPEEEMRAGAFTNPDAGIRRRAVEVAAGGCAWARELGARELIVWSAFDGYDYHLQAGP